MGSVPAAEIFYSLLCDGMMAEGSRNGNCLHSNFDLSENFLVKTFSAQNVYYFGLEISYFWGKFMDIIAILSFCIFCI